MQKATLKVLEKIVNVFLLPAFLSAYHGSNPEKVSTNAFRGTPIPNWTLKYTGLMKIPWFKKTFRRFSIQHGYRSRYTINQFRTNLDYTPGITRVMNMAINLKMP